MPTRANNLIWRQKEPDNPKLCLHKPEDKLKCDNCQDCYCPECGERIEELVNATGVVVFGERCSAECGWVISSIGD